MRLLSLLSPFLLFLPFPVSTPPFTLPFPNRTDPSTLLRRAATTSSKRSRNRPSPASLPTSQSTPPLRQR